MNAKARKPQQPDPVDPRARRKQVIVALSMGLIVGLVLGFFTQFWLYVPAGLAMGLATGVIMRPPEK